MQTIEQAVTQIVARNLVVPAESITPADTIEALGGDSLDLIDIAMEIEDEIGVEISFPEAASCLTVGGLIELAKRAREDDMSVLTDEQIYRLDEDGAFIGNIKEIARAIEQAVLQSPEVQGWKKDAERMEWYFGSADKSPWMPEYMRGCNDGWSVDQWRMSIDAAMEKQP